MSNVPHAASAIHATTTPLRDPFASGIMFGLLAAIGYSSSNICLRAVSHCAPTWVSCVRAVPTVALLGPWLVWQAMRNQRVLPPAKFLVVLSGTALFMHLAGNVSFQWSLGVIGISPAASLVLGSMIVTGAVMARAILKEPITLRMALSIAILSLAIFVLSLGTGSAAEPIQKGIKDQGFWYRLGGVAGACLAGWSYAMLGVVLRWGMTRGMIRGATLGASLLVSSAIGVLSLGALTGLRIGLDEVLLTTPFDFQMMLLAGTLTTVGFVCLARAFQLTTVIFTGMLNASQAAISAVAGVAIFSEPAGGELWIGVTLTVVGLLLMDRARANGTG